MRNLLALLAAVAIGVAGLGWYLGWFHVRSTPSTDGHQQISIDVDKKKIVADVKKGVQEGAHEVEGFLKKEGITSPSPSTPPPVHASPDHSISTNRFKYNPDGSIEYTGEISVPQPIK
jgi:hypothetical protein